MEIAGRILSKAAEKSLIQYDIDSWKVDVAINEACDEWEDDDMVHCFYDHDRDITVKLYLEDGFAKVMNVANGNNIVRLFNQEADNDEEDEFEDDDEF